MARYKLTHTVTTTFESEVEAETILEAMKKSRTGLIWQNELSDSEPLTITKVRAKLMTTKATPAGE